MNDLNKLIHEYGYTKGTIANELKITELAVDNWLKGRNGIGENNQVKLKELLKKVVGKRLDNKTDLVKIPIYVSDVIESAKHTGIKLLSFNQHVWDLNKSGNKQGKQTFEWMNDRKNISDVYKANDKIAEAWMNGYEVAENEYVIILSKQFGGVHPNFGVWSCYVEHTTYTARGKKQYKGIDNCYFNPLTEKDPMFSKENHSITKNAISKHTKYKFTEKEISKIDERFWPFAKEAVSNGGEIK